MNCKHPTLYVLSSENKPAPYSYCVLCEVARLRSEVERLAGSLAACGVIARCDDDESFHRWKIASDNPYWTDSLAAVTQLRESATSLRAERSASGEGALPRLDWSLARRILEQGMAIQQDYAAGKYPTYEHLQCRLDEAARERVAPSHDNAGGA